MGDILDFCAFRESLVSLKKNVDRCIMWIDSGLGLGDVGSKPSPASSVDTEPKSISASFSLSKAHVSILGPPLVADSKPNPKAKAPMGSRVTRVKFSLKA